jgi:hypothetical protein
MSTIIVINVEKNFKACGGVEIKMTSMLTLICGGVKGIVLGVASSTWVMVIKVVFQQVL